MTPFELKRTKKTQFAKTMTLTSLQPFFIYTLFFYPSTFFGIPKYKNSLVHLLLIYCIFYFVKQYFCCFPISSNRYPKITTCSTDTAPAQTTDRQRDTVRCKSNQCVTCYSVLVFNTVKQSPC